MPHAIAELADDTYSRAALFDRRLAARAFHPQDLHRFFPTEAVIL
jgi:hypothetical protein